MGTTTKASRKAVVTKESCVACGACTKVCPRKAISVWKGCFAVVDAYNCVGCGICAKTCPAGCITVKEGGAANEE